MTLAATAPVTSDNHTAIWVVLALLAVFAIVAVLWQHETVSDRHGRAINDHDEQLATLAYQMPALLDWLGVEIPAPVEDDSPSAEESVNLNADTEVQALDAKPEPDDCPTDEFPAQPGLPTEPMAVVDPTPAVQARRDAAWDKQRPTPVPRGKSADWVEDAIKGFDYSGRKR